jgi:hypothetical protein
MLTFKHGTLDCFREPDSLVPKMIPCDPFSVVCRVSQSSLLWVLKNGALQRTFGSPVK